MSSKTAARARRGFVTVTEYVDVAVDVAGHIDSVPTEVMTAELRKRREAGEVFDEDVEPQQADDTLRDIERAVRSGDFMHFDVLMCRLRASLGVAA